MAAIGGNDATPPPPPAPALSLSAVGKAVVAANRLKKVGKLHPRWEGVVEKKGNNKLFVRWVTGRPTATLDPLSRRRTYVE